jgi:predicted molibdopterin-dependent oxidoreductase YjgC
MKTIPMNKLFDIIDNNLKDCIKTKSYNRWKNFTLSLNNHIADRLEYFKHIKDKNSEIKMNYIKVYQLSANKIAIFNNGGIDPLNEKEERDMMRYIKESYTRQKKWKDKDYNVKNGVLDS